MCWFRCTALSVHRGFLEGIVKSTIDNAISNDKLETFDVLVLKTLFLIRYVDEIRGNVDNLVTLFVDRIDADRLALRRRQIEASLQRLEKRPWSDATATISSSLLTRRDISREIKDVDLNSAEEAKFLGELIFEDVLKGIRKHRFSGQQQRLRHQPSVRPASPWYPHRRRLGALLVTPLADEYALYDDGKCTCRVRPKAVSSSSGWTTTRPWVGNCAPIRRPTSMSAARTTEPLRPPRVRSCANARRRTGIAAQRLVRSWSSCAGGGYYAAGQPLQPKSGSAAAALGEALNCLVRNSFNKLGYLTQLGQPQAELKAVPSAADVDDLGFLAGGRPRQSAGRHRYRNTST